jgi:hypothetical protein
MSLALDAARLHAHVAWSERVKECMRESARARVYLSMRSATWAAMREQGRGKGAGLGHAFLYAPANTQTRAHQKAAHDCR